MSEVWMPKERDFGIPFDSAAKAYRDAVKRQQFKIAKTWEAQLKRLDIQLAREGEP